MELIFYLTSLITVISTILVIVSLNPVHALLYFILSLLSVSLIFYALGAQVIAAIEVIIYAGAIMVLFVFIIMILNIRNGENFKNDIYNSNKKIFTKKSVLKVFFPIILILFLTGELVFLLKIRASNPNMITIINPKDIGTRLYTTYLLGVEMSGFLLLAGMVGAYHLGRQRKINLRKEK